jgi:hypothetical protein
MSLLQKLEKDHFIPLRLKPTKIQVKSASGDSLEPLGEVELPLQIGRKNFKLQLIVCNQLSQSLIIGDDAHTKYLLYQKLSRRTKCLVRSLFCDNEELLSVTVMEREEKPSTAWMVSTKQSVVPGFSTAFIQTNLCFARGLTNVETAWETTQSNPLWQADKSITVHQLVHHMAKGQKPLAVITNHSSVPLEVPRGTLICDLKPIEDHTTEIMKISVDYPELFEPPQNLLPPEQEAVTLIHADTEIKLCTPDQVNTKRRVKQKSFPLNPEVEEQLADILKKKYPHLLSTGSDDIGKHDAKLQIPIEGTPCASRPYTIPLKHVDWVQKEIENLLKSGVIRPSLSPWASPCLVVRKKLDITQTIEAKKRIENGEILNLKEMGDLRLVIDYRAVNRKIPQVDKVVKGKVSRAKGAWAIVPIPKINEMYAKLHQARYFSVIDLRAAFHNLTLHPDSVAMTAFVLPWGKWEFVRVPFGLQSSPSWFQGVISNCIQECFKFCFAYLDDLLLFTTLQQAELCFLKSTQSKTPFSQLPDDEQDLWFQRAHLEHIEVILSKLSEFGLKIKLSKCEFFQTQVQYLGHMISPDGIEPVQEKVAAVRELCPPNSVTEVRQFLGMVGYYRQFIDHFSEIAKPLHHLCKKDLDWDWTPQCQKAFDYLRTALTSDSILIYPDPNEEFHLFCDASKHSYAAVLTQLIEDVYRPITYLSGTFRTKSQVAQPIIVKECYAIFQGVRKLDFYLRGAKTVIHSDHKPLATFLHRQTKCEKLNNWSLELQEYNLEYRYINTKDNILADALSRLRRDEIVENPSSDMEDFDFGSVFPDLEEVVHHISTSLPEIDNQRQKVSKEIDQNRLEVLQAVQMTDHLLEEIRNKIRTTKLTGSSPYFLEEGVLFRKLESKGKTYHALVIPAQWLSTLMYELHDLLGHPGMDITYETMRRYYFHPNLKKEVDSYVRKCPVCALEKPTRAQYPKLHLPVPHSPMHTLSIDLIGPFYLKDKENTEYNYALTAVDTLTLFSWAIPLKRKNAEGITDTLLREIFCPFGSPKTLITDNAKEFNSRTLLDILETFGIRHRNVLAYNPRANLVERTHSYLKRCLRSFFTPGSDLHAWHSNLKFATFSWNAVPHKGHDESPFFLMFGRDPFLPVHRLLEPKLRTLFQEDSKINLDELYRNWMRAMMQLKQTRGTDNTFFSREDNAPKLQAGDLVSLKSMQRDDPFSPKFRDGYRIRRIMNPTSAELEHIATGKLHKAQLKFLSKSSPTQTLMSMLPDNKAFGRYAKYINDPRVYTAEIEKEIALQKQQPAQSVVNQRFYNLRSCTGKNLNPQDG